MLEVRAQCVKKASWLGGYTGGSELLVEPKALALSIGGSSGGGGNRGGAEVLGFLYIVFHLVVGAVQRTK